PPPHPDYLFGPSPEHARINPENPFILVNHLKCGAFELPFAEDEAFGASVSAHLAALEEEGLLHQAPCGPSARPSAEDEPFGASVSAHLAALEEEGLLHQAGGVYHWTSETYPADHISLRTGTSDNFLGIDNTAGG